MMNFMFVFCILRILFSNVRCWNFLEFVCLVSLCGVIYASESTTEPLSEDFLLKTAKVIEAGPNVLRRVHSSANIGFNEAWDCSAVKACDDPAGYEAIRGLHRQLDDDANGSIDVSETDEFLRDELQYENGYERHKEFHGNDKYINVDELWQVWRMSEVHNWTVDETVEWLITQVDLPQYEHTFRNNGVNGAFLPLLAQNANNYISHNLGIKDSIHKQKIALKAMDVVLFGIPKYHNYFKDIILGLSLIIAAGGIWFAYAQHKNSQNHIHKMMKDMEALQRAEDSLMDLQKELSKARHQQEIVSIEKQDLERRLQDEMTTSKKVHVNISGEGAEANEGIRISELEKQLQMARNDLREAEKKLEAKHWIAPLSLQHWLQLTHELELRSYNAKKSIAEQQLQAAKEGCEKLSKKRATFMGAFRIAHGSSIDDVDDRIIKAKSALYEVTTDLQERMHRWKQIEVLCGFPIILNPGIACLESILHPNVVNGTTGSTHSGLSTLTQSSTDTTVREESPPPYTGVVPNCLTSTKTTDSRTVKNPRYLVHRDSGISLTSAAQSPATTISVVAKNGIGTNIPPPPSYSKSSPSFIGKTSDIPCFATAIPSVSRVVYPRECYRPSDNVSSFETDNEDMQIAEVDDDSTERSITPPSLASCPETVPVTFSLFDGTSLDAFPPQQKAKDFDNHSQLSIEHYNGKMSGIVRKISSSILSDKKKKLPSFAVEAIKKSASSSNIMDSNDGGASSESSSSIAADEKIKKKKFFNSFATGSKNLDLSP